LITARALEEDRERLNRYVDGLNAWSARVRDLHGRIEQSIASSTTSEEGKKLLRMTWYSDRRKWEGPLLELRSAYYRWAHAVADVHAFMKARVGLTSVNGDSIVFKTAEEARAYQQLYAAADAARRSIDLAIERWNDTIDKLEHAR
jgi:hypothetical protein